MNKKIIIGNKEIEMTVTGATPLRYRNAFKGHDIMTEMSRMKVAEDGTLDGVDFGMIERLAYIMAKPSESFEEWLEQFGPMDILNASEAILGLFVDSNETQAVQGKNTEAADQ